MDNERDAEWRRHERQVQAAMERAWKVRPLTACGVEAMLTKAGVDYSALTITDVPDVWSGLAAELPGLKSVKIEGPSEQRALPFHALIDRPDLSVAPYPEYDV